MAFQLSSINHITFSVSNLSESRHFYEHVLGAKVVYKWHTGVYYDLADMWIALNVETDIPRAEIHQSYTHIAFTVNDTDFSMALKHLDNLAVHYEYERSRSDDDGQSVYFSDPDGHKFEFHSGSLAQRITYFKAINK